MAAKHRGNPAPVLRAVHEGQHRARPISTTELKQGIAALCGMRERGELSAAGLVDALVVLAEHYAEQQT